MAHELFVRFFIFILKLSMRLLISVLLFFAMSLELSAQSDTTTKQLQEVVIYANKFPALSKNIVQKPYGCKN